MADSILPALQSSLVTLLAGTAGLSGVKVSFGPPPDPEPEEYVAVGIGRDPEEVTRDFRVMMGGAAQNPLDEDYTKRLSVVAQKATGADLQPSYTRAWALAAVVETALRADLTVGGVSQFPMHIERMRGEFFRTDKFRGYRIFVDLTGSTRI